MITTNQSPQPPPSRLKIALLCDFFYPRLGGVEMHIWYLSQHLLRLGHKVIIITHAYSSSSKLHRRGVRYLPGPIKVYYCPLRPFADQATLPTFLVSYPLIRWILIREGINVVHAHQATSPLANEGLVYAAELRLVGVYTDHSLFGFDDVASLVLNKVISTTLSTVRSAICVSHTCRENLILRAMLDPKIVYVIPNAIDSEKFRPDPSRRSKDCITIIIISRLAYRKGADLLLSIIPLICHLHPHISILIGGDGPKAPLLRQTIHHHNLSDRVTLLGSLPHNRVREVLSRGHIFLNCSLTESFCMAILEAACVGLYVVSTDVGGVREVLPGDMVTLADVTVESMVEGLDGAIKKVEKEMTNGEDKKVAWERHERVRKMYDWKRVAKMTVGVYETAWGKKKLTFLERLRRYRSVGRVAGIVACLAFVTVHFWTILVGWWWPRDGIDLVPDLGNQMDVEEEEWDVGTAIDKSGGSKKVRATDAIGS